MSSDKGNERFYGRTPEKNYIHGKAIEVDQVVQDGRQLYEGFSIPPVTQDSRRK